MDAPNRSHLDWKVAGAGFSLLPVGVGVVTGNPLLGVAAVCCLLLAVGLVYPFATFASESE
ncbi:hypothetical protein C474_12741 [Halogeometricum pallidum JCM 14848]|uniref:Uncharacterized protein n=1 Tax=Halogeometricum pallidum JCM 14848 TaxID=1227487 RepID=M0D4X2_HALPD|nr:hypothetical protein [Halogeometricum pallidum]ELZ29903.1 hypothetical protein C474_12741 [Halogeometricum pallidum JCM 14848]